jgi:hypothetical protein
MIIWIALLLPVFAALFLMTTAKNKVVLWEYLLLLVPVTSVIVSYFIALGVRQVDTEYWNGYVNSATYYQSWQTWVHRTCYRNVNCRQVCSGSGESRSCHEVCDRVPYDCSYCADHSEEWTASDNLGSTWNITPTTFDTWAQSWSNRSFVELNRPINYHNGFLVTCGRDGDAYRTVFNNDSSKIVPVTLTKHYINKIQTTFQKVDTSEVTQYELFNYPTYDRFSYNPVLGLNDIRVSNRLAQWNARLGQQKQVHMLLLVFRDQPIEAAEHQSQYWKGGNKNEFILAVGERKDCMWDSTGIAVPCRDIIEWAKVISWTDQRDLKQHVESAVLNMHGIDYFAIVDTMAANVKQSFVRKNWHTFDNIKVEPSRTAAIVTLILSILVTVTIGIYVVANGTTKD